MPGKRDNPGPPEKVSRHLAETPARNDTLGELLDSAAGGPIIAWLSFNPVAFLDLAVWQPFTSMFLHASLWSHTGYLGMSLIGLAAAPVIAALMAWTAHLFRSKLRDRLLQKKALVRSGKVAGNGILVRTTCWFFDL